jgi:hypothetical protein
MIEESLITVLTGMTMLILAGFVYQTTDTAFISGGSFRSKEEALLILSAKILGVSLVTPLVRAFWQETVYQLGVVPIFGVALMVGITIVNYSIDNWNYLDDKSLGIYGVGVVLLLIG